MTAGLAVAKLAVLPTQCGIPRPAEYRAAQMRHLPPLALVGGRVRQRLIAVSPDSIQFDAQFRGPSRFAITSHQA